MPAAPAAPPPTAPPPAAPKPAPAPPPAAPATPETPMSRMRQRMATESVMADPSDPDPMRMVKPMPKGQEPPKPPETKPPETAPATDELELEGDEPAKPPETKTEDTPPPADKPPEKLVDEKGKPIDPKKVSPWKLLDQFKGRLTATEKENVELKERLSKVPDITRLEAIDKRNKELEEEIKYQNYAKSEDFAKNYQKPYEEAWAKAISDLGELEVLAEDGSASRKATASDLISLARLPLGEARKLANQMFGDSASDVMMHRQKIRDLSDAQNRALEEAKKSGNDRQEQYAARMQSVVKEVSTLWEKFNTEDASKYEFLKPREGDDEFNTKLTKAQTLVDTAFSTNATDPNLTPEQRAQAVRAHSAVRNRAIAYSALKLENARLQKQIAERDAKLKQYEQSEPTGGSAGGATGKPQQASTPMERARQRMHAEAVPAPNYF